MSPVISPRRRSDPPPLPKAAGYGDLLKQFADFGLGVGRIDTRQESLRCPAVRVVAQLSLRLAEAV